MTRETQTHKRHHTDQRTGTAGAGARLTMICGQMALAMSLVPRPGRQSGCTLPEDATAQTAKVITLHSGSHRRSNTTPSRSAVPASTGCTSNFPSSVSPLAGEASTDPQVLARDLTSWFCSLDLKSAQTFEAPLFLGRTACLKHQNGNHAICQIHSPSRPPQKDRTQ